MSGCKRLMLLWVRFVWDCRKKMDNRPVTIQADRTRLVAPIVKAYLELADKAHFQGQYFTATWDGETQMLSLLQSNQLKLLARWDEQQWQPLPIPLKNPSQPNLSEADVVHFQGLEPRIQGRLRQRRDNYRAWYESARSRVLAAQSLESEEAIDWAIAASVAYESSDPKDIRRVLAQSDLLNVWREEMSVEVFRQRAGEYLEGRQEAVLRQEAGGRGQEVGEVLRQELGADFSR